ncbi:MAG: hypothetical protein MMC33_009108 [Icmadophila ericetorum]|nr:hypothetical protein [Icmadophila ericetorum]
MSLYLGSLRAPKCLSCLRRSIAIELREPVSTFRVQLRGKKKSAKDTGTIQVKLLRDIRGWGRQGSIVPVAPGRMRNIWHPQGKAQYMTTDQLKAIPDLVAERDTTFGVEETKETQPVSPPDIQLKLIKPARASQLLAKHVPECIDFYRSVIPSSESVAKHNVEDASKPGTKGRVASMPEPASLIFGSVSTADISENIMAVLNMKALTDEEVGRVVLRPEDIRIEANAAGDEKIKALGEYKVVIQMKGGDVVERTVRVMEQE